MKKTIKILFILLTLSAFISPAVFAVVPKLQIPRVGHTTTLLPNGDILVTGGHNNKGSLVASDEVFRSSTGEFEYTVNSMGVRRSSHTATLLPNGDVLIFGGIDGTGKTVDNIEIYNPIQRKFIKRDGSATYGANSRAGHTAVLLYKGNHKNQVFACGGRRITAGPTNQTVSNCVYIKSTHNSGTGDLSYSIAGSINMETASGALRGRFDHTATLLSNGNVFISGGRLSNFSDTELYPKGNEVYNAETDEFLMNDETLSIARRDHSAVSLSDGKVAIIGGYNPNYSYTYDSGTPYDINSPDNWYNSGQGGYFVKDRHNPGFHGYLDTIEVFDKDGKSTIISGNGEAKTMPYRLAKAAGVLSPDGRILLNGGRGNIPMTTAQVGIIFSTGSYLDLESGSASGSNYNALVNTSAGKSNKVTIELPATTLSRPVSGKFINADMFIPTSDPKGIGIKQGSDTQGGFEVSFIDNSKKDIRAVLDGLPVGRYIEAYEGNSKYYPSGQIEYKSVPITDLAGNVTIYPMELSAVKLLTGNLSGWKTTGGSTAGTESLCDAGATCKGYVNLTGVKISLTVPTHFAGSKLSGKVIMTEGLVFSLQKTSTGDSWGIELVPQESTFPKEFSYSNKPVSCTESTDNKTCKVDINGITFNNIYFEGVNPSTHTLTITTFTSIAASREFSSFNGTLTINPDRIYLENVSYAADISTIVVRDMLFSNTLSFDPKTSSWDTTVGEKPSSNMYEWTASGWDEIIPPDVSGLPAPLEPNQTALVNHSMVITASGSPMILGGRSCNSYYSGETYVPKCTRSNYPATSTTEETFEKKETGPENAGGAHLKINTNRFLTTDMVYPKQGDGGSLLTPRDGHTTTALHDGSVLVCGGTGYEDGVKKTLSSCERYNPETKQWEYTGSMSTPRAGHTANLLPNGKVIQVGGTDGKNPLNSSEVYNPANHKFDSKLTYLNTPRQNHTATLLANGNIFVVGGAKVDYNEVFITTRAVWETRYTGQPKFSHHTATLMKDGKVIVIGGDSGGGFATAQYRIYNPQNYDTDPSVKTGNISQYYSYGGSCDNEKKISPYAISQHVTMLDKNGNLWLIGGASGDQISSNVLFFQYNSGATASDSSLGVSKCGVTNGGQLEGHLRAPAVGHTAVISPDSMITVFGGRSQDRALGYINKIDTELHDVFSLISDNAITPRSNHTTVLDSSGNFFVVGGNDAQGKYVEKVDRHYFTIIPDSFMNSSELSESPRIPRITRLYSEEDDESQNVVPGANMTLLSTGSFNNFHGFTDAGNGYGVHHNTPKLMLLAMDNPSGFLIDISTVAYSTSTTGGNFQWDVMLSSITVKLPGGKSNDGTGKVNPEMPWGYFYAVESLNGQFSNFKTVQVGENWTLNKVPEPVAPSTKTFTYETVKYGTGISGYTVYTSSIVWQWPNLIPNNPNPGDNTNVNGYEVYSATSAETGASLARIVQSVAVSTFVQTGLTPNYPARIKVVPYNIWTEGDEFTYSDIWYTLAEKPVLSISAPNFDNALLEWTSNNYEGTCYQVDWCRLVPNASLGANCFTTDNVRDSSGTFSATSFAAGNCYSSSSFTATGLTPVTGYKFQVKAINGTQPFDWPTHEHGSGHMTDPSNVVSTITVSSVNDITATPSTSTIIWTWTPVNARYEVEYIVKEVVDDIEYDISSFEVSSSTVKYSYTQKTAHNGLGPNRPYRISVQPVMKESENVKYYGGKTYSDTVFTLANTPANLSMTPEYLSNSKGKQALEITWYPNSNSADTFYSLQLSTTSDFENIVYSTRTLYYDSKLLDMLDVNTCYYGRIAAVNNGDVETPYVLSNSKACTFANPPSGLKVDSNEITGITISWNKNNNPDVYNTNGIQIGTRYKVFISTDNTFPDELTITDYTYDSTYLFSGLRTETLYYMTVIAESLGGNVSAPTGGLLSAVSVSGPEGTTPGSIIGISDPNNPINITGQLANGRYVNLYIPAETYSTETQIAIASTAVQGIYDCEYESVSNIGTVIFTDDNNPKVPMQLTLGYNNTNEQDDINTNTDEIVLARYSNGVCLPLNTFINTSANRISASVNSLKYSVSGSSGTVIMLIRMVPPSNLSRVKVYPNPFYPNNGDGNVKVEPVPPNTKLTLYTLSGAKVWEGNSDKRSIIEWEGVNKHGNPVASGVYIGVLDSPAGKKKIKIAVER